MIYRGAKSDCQSGPKESIEVGQITVSKWANSEYRNHAKSATITVSHWATRGVGLFRSRDLNAPPPPDYLARPDPAISVERQIESSGHLQSDALEVMFRGSLTRYFTGMAQYTLGRTWTDVPGNYAAGTRSTGINSFPSNNYDLSSEWARADYDQRHRLNLLAAVRPVRLLNLGVGLTVNSGTPYSMTTGRDDNHDGLANDRPAGVPRNSLEGPGYSALDLRWSYDWRLQKTKKDGAKLTLRGGQACEAAAAFGSFWFLIIRFCARNRRSGFAEARAAIPNLRAVPATSTRRCLLQRAGGTRDNV